MTIQDGVQYACSPCSYKTAAMMHKQGESPGPTAGHCRRLGPAEHERAVRPGARRAAALRQAAAGLLNQCAAGPSGRSHVHAGRQCRYLLLASVTVVQSSNSGLVPDLSPCTLVHNNYLFRHLIVYHHLFNVVMHCRADDALGRWLLGKLHLHC